MTSILQGVAIAASLALGMLEQAPFACVGALAIAAALNGLEQWLDSGRYTADLDERMDALQDDEREYRIEVRELTDELRAEIKDLKSKASKGDLANAIEGVKLGVRGR